MKRTIIVLVLVSALFGCTPKHNSVFDQTCRDLAIKPQVVSALREFKENRGGNNTAHFELLRAFCMRRQIAAPRKQHPELADPILNAASIVVLLGEPDAKTDDGAWLYFFNSEKDWHLELRFRDGKLFHTSYRQLISGENITTNHGLESTGAPPAAGTLETHP